MHTYIHGDFFGIHHGDDDDDVANAHFIIESARTDHPRAAAACN